MSKPVAKICEEVSEVLDKYKLEPYEILGILETIKSWYVYDTQKKFREGLIP